MNFRLSFDPFIYLPVIGLSGISLFIISATAADLLWPQTVFLIVGVVIFLIFASLDYRLFSKFFWMIYAISLLLLIASLLGPAVRGSTRWIDLGAFRLQPSELIKPFVIVVLASLITRQKTMNPGLFFRVLLILLPVLFLIFKQPDLGNVLIYMAVFFSLAVLGGFDRKYLLIGGITILVFLPLAWHLLQDYQRLRLISFINPHADPLGSGYNALQAMIAIGSGQFWGLGLGHGTQSRLLFLPEYHTDFVFASLGENLGFVGGFLVIIFYLILLGRMILISIKSNDYFGKILSIGVFAQLFVQVFINIGMNLGILPITGITLPLLSYGGSSIISTFIGLGLVVSVTAQNKKTPLVIG